MSACTKSLVLSSLVLSCLPGRGQAQIVDVQPGYIRAPFVRVYRSPDGSTRVRAPFVNVNSDGPGRVGSPRETYGVPPVPPIDARAPGVSDAAATPTEIDVTKADWQSLQSIVRAGEADLENQLNRYGTGDRWKARLYAGSLRQILTTENNQPPVGDTRHQLQTVLNAYDQVSANPAYRPVTRLSGFRAVHGALRELLLSPLERKRARLAAAAFELDEALVRMRNGATWATYLRLPESVFAPDAGTDGQTNGLTDVLERFQSVSVDYRYGVIAALPEFQATHRHLADYVALLKQQLSPQLEELPPPPADELPPSGP